MKSRRAVRLLIAFLVVALATPAARAVDLSLDADGPLLRPVTPLDRGHVDVTTTPLHPLAVRAIDASALDTDSADVELVDATTGARSRPEARVSGDRLSSVPIPLTAGHRYLATFSVDDIAGNPARALTIEFAAISVDVPPVQPAISEVTPTTVTHLPTGRTSMTFENVAVDLPSHVVQIEGRPLHGGIGYFQQVVDLGQATLRVGDAGVAQRLAGAVAVPLAAPRQRVLTQAHVFDDAPDQRLLITMVTVSMPRLTVELPGTVHTATLSMNGPDDPTSWTSASVPTCSAADLVCPPDRYPTADPFPYYFSDEESQAFRNARARYEARVPAAAVAATSIPACAGGANAKTCEKLEAEEVVGGLMYQVDLDPVEVVWNLASTVAPYHQTVWPRLDYLHDYPVFFPEVYAYDCRKVACDGDIASANSIALAGGASQFDASGARTAAAPAATRTFCADQGGNLNAERRNCYQWVASHLSHLMVGSSGRDHYIIGYMSATVGLSEGEADEFTIAVNDRRESPISPAWKDVGVASGQKSIPEATYNEFMFDWDGRYDYSRYHEGVKTGQCHVLWNDSLGGAGWTNWQLRTWNSTQSRTNERWFGAVVSPWMPQRTKGDSVDDVYPCWGRPGGDPDVPNWAKFNRIGFAIIDAEPVWTNAGGRKGILEFAYGHNKTTTKWDFGCGPGFGVGVTGPDVSFGCGWTASSNEKKVWAINARSDFTF